MIDNENTPAKIWFRSLNRYELPKVCIKYKVKEGQPLTDEQIEQIYLAEHPQLTTIEKEEDILSGITKGDWTGGNISTSIMCGDKFIGYACAYNDNEGMIIPQKEAEANTRIMMSAPKLAIENRELKARIIELENAMNHLIEGM